MRDTVYFEQARLLLQVLPLVGRESVFALKGGTAINFFVRDMPRLSVDIDLTYLPVTDRATALAGIHEGLMRIAEETRKRIPGSVVSPKKNSGTGTIAGLDIRRGGVTIKIETNLVLRGSVFSPETRTLCRRAQETFELSIEARTLSIEDLYGGKACAALDRQHPRDLFDIHLLSRHEGFSERMRKAFIVYLVSHDRPMSEVIDPHWGDLRSVFEREFQGMVADPVTVEELAGAGIQLLSWVRSTMTEDERRFILSVKEGRPEWVLLGITGIDRLPGVQWKLQNIAKMKPEKHREAVSSKTVSECKGTNISHP